MKLRLELPRACQSEECRIRPERDDLATRGNSRTLAGTLAEVLNTLLGWLEQLPIMIITDRDERILDFKVSKLSDQFLYSRGFGVLIPLERLVKNDAKLVASLPTESAPQLRDSVLQ